MDQPIREYLPFLPDWTLYLMYLLFFATVGVIIWGIRNKIKNYELNMTEFAQELGRVYKNHRGDLIDRFMTYVMGQKKVRRMNYGGIMHMFLFYSMILLFIGTFLIFFEQDILKHLGVEHLIQGNFYLAYEFILDVSGLFLIVGLGMALYRRLVLQPDYLKSSKESYIILSCLLYIGLSGFIMEGIRLALNPVPWGIYSFVGYSFSVLFGAFSMELLSILYPLLWWSHFAAVMAFLVITPFTVLKHAVLIPLNMALLPFDRSKPKMTTPFKVMELEEMEESEEETELKIGIYQSADLSWKQKLNLAACVNCGRCESVCPAHASGRELSPRRLVQKLKGSFDTFSLVSEEQKHENFFDPGLITEDEVWSCTNCGACVEECPAMINQVDYIMDLRRYLVSENRLDNQKSTVFANLDQNFNPFGLPSYKRNDWLVDLGVPHIGEHPEAEYLYWVGDAGAYDPRAQQIVKSFVEIMKIANIDFAIMSHDEKNDGEIAKRMGEEGRYQLIAMENIAALDTYGVQKIVTHDPHAFNMLKNEYPEFGGHYEVTHHSVFIQRLLDEGLIPINKKAVERVVYHDPCNLARWNNISEEPRQVLSSVVETPLLEIEQSKDRTFCCGAGGGNYWYKVPGEEKISSIRLKQLETVNPDTIAVGCPYCLLMMEDAARTSDSEIKIRDLAEIVHEQLQKKQVDEDAGIEEALVMQK